MMDKNKKVVNTEEQNNAVNPQDKDYNEAATGSAEQVVNTSSNSHPGETDTPEEGVVERPRQIEGDDASGIERKVPNI